MNERMKKVSIVSFVVASGAAIGLSGCRSTTQANLEPTSEFSSGLSALVDSEAGATLDPEAFEQLLTGDHDELQDMIQASYETLERAFADAESSATPLPELDDALAYDESEIIDITDTLLATNDMGSAGLDVLLNETESTSTPAIDTSIDPVSAIRSASRDLADAILAHMPFSLAPVDDALALVGLESLVPGVSEAAIASGTLSADERTYVQSALRLSDAVRAVDVDPDAPVTTAQQVAMDLAETRPIAITRASLCTRVDGYGQFTTFASNRFVAGKRQRVIVYVEVDRLGHETMSPASGEMTPRYAVELTQKIEVFHSADNVLALATPTLTDRRVGRNRFRDYYVVTAVDLPETLSIGEYQIKVTMRDAADDGMAQVMIPLTIVANASALAGDTP